MVVPAHMVYCLSRLGPGQSPRPTREVKTAPGRPAFRGLPREDLRQLRPSSIDFARRSKKYENTLGCDARLGVEFGSDR